jgi:hypothetical protein
MTDLKRLILITLVTALIFGVGKVLAVDKQIVQIQSSALNVVPTVMQYPLPDPGMLSNHPLYFLKSFRDKLLEFFIRDPNKKIEFTILQADKFLSMAIKQSSDSQWNAVSDSINQAYKYAQKAQSGIVKLKLTNGIYPGYLKENLLASINKHLEVMGNIQKKVPQESEMLISADINRFWTLLEDVKEL